MPDLLHKNCQLTLSGNVISVRRLFAFLRVNERKGDFSPTKAPPDREYMRQAASAPDCRRTGTHRIATPLVTIHTLGMGTNSIHHSSN
jgi:hypothetical protein